MRAPRIRNLGTCFFVHLITFFHTRSCTSNFMHFKQLFLYACTLMCTSLCTQYKNGNILEWKVNLRSIPLTINPEPSLDIQTIYYRERKNRRVSCPHRAKQPGNFPSTMFESIEHDWSFLMLTFLHDGQMYFNKCMSHFRQTLQCFQTLPLA